VRLSAIDWRWSSTKRVFQALSDGLRDVRRDFDDAQEDHQLDDALEHTESLLGIAFVTAQTYIAGTVSDANKLLRGGTKITKEQLLKVYGNRLGELLVTDVELCDAIANYFKHHNEWGSWSTAGRNQKTVSILRAAGIQETDQFPCSGAADILWSNNDGPDLEPLLVIISNWRKSVITACQK
jgi:hypothetical protein